MTITKTGIAKRYITRSVITIAMALRQKPLLTICGIVTYPEQKTMAFGEHEVA